MVQKRNLENDVDSEVSVKNSLTKIYISPLKYTCEIYLSAFFKTAQHMIKAPSLLFTKGLYVSKSWFQA